MRTDAGGPGGKGPSEGIPLVLLHGLGSASTFWDNLVPHLEPRYQVHAIDLPGHGPDAKRLDPDEAHPAALAATIAHDLHAAGVETFHVAGLSLGGWVALELAALESAESVTALAPAGLWREGARVRREYANEALSHWLHIAGATVPAFSRLTVARDLVLRSDVVHPKKVTRQQFVDAAVALGQARSFGLCDQAAVRYRFENAKAVQVPTTIAFGDRDRQIPEDGGRERDLAPPDAEWVDVAECGHVMTWDQPEACVELIGATVSRAIAPS